MDSTGSIERGIKLPDFSGDRLTMLGQLSTLAAQRVPNDFWYAIERLGNDVAYTVSGLLDAHIYHEGGMRAKGAEPMKFIDFVPAELEKLIAHEQDSAEALSEKIIVAPEPPSLEQSVQTAADVNKMIRAALRRPRVNKRQYSNTHNRPR